MIAGAGGRGTRAESGTGAGIVMWRRRQRATRLLSRARWFAPMFAALLPLAACTPGMFHAEIDRPAGAPELAPGDPSLVREVAAPHPGPDVDERLTAAIAAPYQVLAVVDAIGAGGRAVKLGRERLRNETARLGGNAMVVLDVRKESAGPYTHVYGYALRVLPPMADAGARCAALQRPDSAAAAVVACREAARQRAGDATPAMTLALAQVALAVGTREPAQVQRALFDASAAMRAAARRDAALADAMPWVDAVTPLVRGDRELAAMIVSRRLEDAGLAAGALAAAREAMRVAPDSVNPFTRAFDLLRNERRWSEAAALASAFTRGHPGLVEGWVRLGIAANRQGEHERAMRYFARALAIDGDVLDAGMLVPPGYAEYRESLRLAGRQKPATVEELP